MASRYMQLAESTDSRLAVEVLQGHGGRRALLERYGLVDFRSHGGRRGSVVTRCYVVLLQGSAETGPALLQIKESRTLGA